MPATASMGKTIYWEPVGYSVPLHLIGDVKDIAEGWMRLNPRDIAEQNNYVYAIVKPNELAEAIPAHPYVVFMEQYRLAKCSKYGGYSELMAYRRHVLPYMAEALKKREDDTSNDRWKDLTLFDLSQVTLAICENWEKMGLYANERYYEMEKANIDLAAWMRGWRNCMSMSIGDLYLDKHSVEHDDVKRAELFTARWGVEDTEPGYHAESYQAMTAGVMNLKAPEDKPAEDKPLQATKMPDIDESIKDMLTEVRKTPPEPQVREVMVMADADTNDQILGPRTMHNIVCMADLTFTMQFDVTESTLKQCVDIVGGELCDVVDDIKVGPNNFVQVKLRKELADSWPLVLNDFSLESQFKTVEFIYTKLVALTQCVAATQEALHAHVVH